MSNEHDWCLTVVIPLTDRERRDMADGVRKVFKVDPLSRSGVRARAVVCSVCHVTADDALAAYDCVGELF